MTLAPSGADPRPTVDGRRVVGVRCAACGHVAASPDRRCRRCSAAVDPDHFSPDGVVWAAATVHLAVDHRRPPFILAYVDLDHGPRILTLVEGEIEPDVGTRVSIVGQQAGDVVVTAVGHG